MKEVTLNIRSMQNGKETSNIYTVASMKKCRESYDFVFDSPDEKTFDAKKLRLSLFRDGLSLCADGTSKLADMVLEKGKKHYCYFPGNNGDENIAVGIDTYRVTSDMTDEGGNFEVEYYMDHNCSNTSRNIMQVSVKPNV